MVIIGIDAHKRTHTVVAVDEQGRELARKTVAATTQGPSGAVRVGAATASSGCGRWRTAGICRGAGARPVAAGERIVRVAAEADGPRARLGPYLRQVRPDRRPGGRPSRATRAGLPTARLDGPERRCGCWSTTAKTSSQNAPASSDRLRWHLHELDPTWEPRLARWTGPAPTTPSKPTWTRCPTPALVARLARSLVSACAPDRRDRPAARRDQARVHKLVPTLLAVVGVRPADRGEDPRRDRRDRPVHLQGRLRPPQRHRAAAGLVVQPSPPPALPHRQPAAQRRPAPHRADPERAIHPPRP